jgi:hypothetical protein
MMMSVTTAIAGANLFYFLSSSFVEAHFIFAADPR